MSLPDYIIENIKNPNTRDIELDGLVFFDKDITDIEELVELLNKNPHVISLSFYRSNLSNVFSSILAGLKYIRKLYLEANNFNDDGLMPLITKSNFTHIDFSRNNLSNNGVQLIKQYSKQIWVNINENPSITEETTVGLNQILSRNKAENLKHMLLGHKSPEQNPSVASPTVTVGGKYTPNSK